MSRDTDCAHVRELAPEIALDIAIGEERDLAVRHLARCADCRRTVSELSTLGDDLLLLAPEADPPAGFSDHVLAPVARPARRPRRWVTTLAAAAAIVAAAAGGAGAVLQATSADRRVAGSYRELLSRAGGSFFVVAPFEGAGGRIGTVFVYAGKPSWVYITLDEPAAMRQLVAEIVTGDGSRVPLGPAVLGGGQSAWGAELPADPGTVTALRFRAADGSIVFRARLDSPTAVRAGWEPDRPR